MPLFAWQDASSGGLSVEGITPLPEGEVHGSGPFSKIFRRFIRHNNNMLLAMTSSGAFLAGHGGFSATSGSRMKGRMYSSIIGSLKADAGDAVRCVLLGSEASFHSSA